jgi:DNA-binding beta-propeller fold protein YncE
VRFHPSITFISSLLTSLTGLLGILSLGHASTVTILEPPGRDEVPRIDLATHRATLVNGRRVTPAGEVIYTQSYNWGMAVDRSGTRVALINRDAVQIVTLGPPHSVRRYPPYGEQAPVAAGTGTYMGCTFSPDGRLLYYGSANQGQIKTLDLETGAILRSIDINGDGYQDSFLGDFVLDPTGRQLIAVDQHNFRLVQVDLEQGNVIRSVRVGRNPFAVSLSRDGRSAWVSNVGMFEYPLLPGVNPTNRATAGLSFPAYGIPSKEAEEGVVVDGTFIPGLGSPNHPDAMSVFRVDLQTGEILHRLKTGYLVGVERDDILTVGGASPGALAVGSRFIYVANASNDTISVINAQSGALETDIELNVPELEQLRGVLPFGCCLDATEERLYVACAGLNAVAVVDTRARQLLGYIPAGWFCAFVQLTPDGRHLLVSSAKGLGSGPNGGRGFVAPIRGTHPGDIMQGTLQIIPVPSTADLPAHTRQTLANTYQTRVIQDDPTHPLPPRRGLRQSPIRHIVFIVKENRTFDQVYGQRPGVRGDDSLSDLGLKRTVRNKSGTRSLENVDVSPNHHALADQFAISDNFYCDADQSNTGHRWIVGVYPNEWVEVNARSRIEEKIFSTAPGRRYVSGANAVVNPEDYNEAGALWEHLHRHQVNFFNFGFGTEMPGSVAEQLHKHTGVQMSVGFPLPEPLLDRTSRKFATYNMAIPDQFRVDMFEEELRDRWVLGREPFPSLITMVLPNDHLSSERPADGYPFEASFMADNDLALGRVVQLLSRTPWWQHMLIIVTEDDAQGGRDHVEAHRSILLMISPHVQRGFVSHTHASFGSIMRMIFILLHLPSLNQFDHAASLPRDFFTSTPNYRPYSLVPIDRQLFDPDVAFKPFDRRFNWNAMLDSPVMDHPDDMRRNFEDPPPAP